MLEFTSGGTIPLYELKKIDELWETVLHPDTLERDVDLLGLST
jgi:hypothetical protein